MPREPKHASNRQAEEIDAEMDDTPLSKRQQAIDGIAPSRNELKKQMQDLQELGEAVAALPVDRLDKLKIDGFFAPNAFWREFWTIDPVSMLPFTLICE